MFCHHGIVSVTAHFALTIQELLQRCCRLNIGHNNANVPELCLLGK